MPPPIQSHLLPGSPDGAGAAAGDSMAEALIGSLAFGFRIAFTSGMTSDPILATVSKKPWILPAS